MRGKGKSMRRKTLRFEMLGTACAAMMALHSGAATAQLVTTFAGKADTPGAADAGQGLFRQPAGSALDGAGNLYVSDYGNHTIRRITPAGVVTTIAGSAGIAGSTDAIGTKARFYYPEGLAVDSQGNVYVADDGNHTIRRLEASTWNVTTIAGSAGSAGNQDGYGAAARFHSPASLGFDSSGFLYVTDYYNHSIRMLSFDTSHQQWYVATIAGSGSPGSADANGTSAQFRYPFGLAIDRSSNLYVADYGNNTIRMVTSGARTVTTLAGTAGTSGSVDGFRASARFYGPGGVAVDNAGNVFVTDSLNQTIRRITPDGRVTTIVGSAGNAGEVDGAGTVIPRFHDPLLATLDDRGNLYVPDYSGHTIRKVALRVLPLVAKDQTQTSYRFMATLSYSGYSSDVQGFGTPHLLADNVGYFGTADPDSADVVVKMIDFCRANNWSVYIGGTTDINTSVTITDTLTGRVSVPFVNTLGHDFQLIKNAVFTCP